MYRKLPPYKSDQIYFELFFNNLWIIYFGINQKYQKSTIPKIHLKMVGKGVLLFYKLFGKLKQLILWKDIFG